MKSLQKPPLVACTIDMVATHLIPHRVHSSRVGCLWVEGLMGLIILMYSGGYDIEEMLHLYSGPAAA